VSVFFKNSVQDSYVYLVLVNLVIPSLQPQAAVRLLQSVDISGTVALSLGIGSSGSPEVTCSWTALAHGPRDPQIFLIITE